MQVPATQVSLVDASNRSADEGVSVLTEVDFKWLMAGHGWWMDTTRFHRDPSYAAGLLGLAMASESLALRDCAATLQAQLGGTVACGTGLLGT